MGSKGRWYIDPMTGVRMYSSFNTKKGEIRYHERLAQQSPNTAVQQAAARHVAELAGRKRQAAPFGGKPERSAPTVPYVPPEVAEEVENPAKRQALLMYLLQLRERMAARVR